MDSLRRQGPRQPRLHVGNHRQDIPFAPSDRELISGMVLEAIERHGRDLRRTPVPVFPRNVVAIATDRF